MEFKDNRLIYIDGHKVSHKQTADGKAPLIGKEIGTTKQKRRYSPTETGEGCFDSKIPAITDSSM